MYLQVAFECLLSFFSSRNGLESELLTMLCFYVGRVKSFRRIEIKLLYTVLFDMLFFIVDILIFEMGLGTYFVM